MNAIASILCFEMISQLAPWQERMCAAAAEQKRIQDEERAARLAATPPTPEPGTVLWNNMTGLQRMVVALRAQERREADERKPRPIPAAEPQSHIIDATYAEQLGKRLLGANAQAIAQCESRKAFEQTKDSK